MGYSERDVSMSGHVGSDLPSKHIPCLRCRVINGLRKEKRYLAGTYRATVPGGSISSHFVSRYVSHWLTNYLLFLGFAMLTLLKLSVKLLLMDWFFISLI